MFNLAFQLVTDGASYTVPSTTCGGSPIVPLIVVPTGEANQTAQVQVVAVDVVGAGYTCATCNTTVG